MSHGNLDTSSLAPRTFAPARTRATARVVLRVAPSGVRVLAGLIDVVPIALATAGAWWLGAGGAHALVPADVAFLPEHIGDTWNLSPWIFARPLIVPMLFSMLWLGTWLALLNNTPGKRLLGLTLVGSDGSPLDGRRAFLRIGAYLVSFATLGLGWLLSLILPSRRTLHDVLSDSWVVSADD